MQPDELRALAAPKPVRSRDLHPFNGFYGHDAVLKRYAGLPERTVAKLAIEHGLDLTGLVPDVDRRLALPLHLCFSERRAHELEAAVPGTEAVAVGPLILYADALAAKPAATGGRRRLLLLPAHSFDAGTVEYDVERLLAAVAEHPGRFEETVACLYWSDALRGRDAEYRARGVECVTAGHRNDSLFLVRLAAAFRSADAVVTNSVGTHVLYATALRKPVWVVPQPVRYLPGGDHGLPPDQQAALDLLNRGGSELAAEVARRFAEPSEELTDEQLSFADELCGMTDFRAPQEVAELFARAEAEYVRRVARPRRLALRAAAELRRRRMRR